MGRARLGAVQLAAQRHNLFHAGPAGGPFALGYSAGDLPADLQSRFGPRADRPREEREANGPSKKKRRKQHVQDATDRAANLPDSPQSWLAVAALEACLVLLPGALAAGLGFVLRRINYEDSTLENTAFGL